VHGFEAEEAFSEGRGKSLIGLGLVHEEGVPTSGRHVERVQEGRSWGLLLVGDIAVPGDGVGAVVEEGSRGLVVGAAMDQVDFWVAGWGTRCGVDVQTAEVSAKIEGLLDGEGGEILVTEGYHFLLGNEEGKLVLARVGKGAKLSSPYFCADGGGDVFDLATFRKEVWECWVGVFAVVDVLEWFQGWVPEKKIEPSASY
jgi:hypothetical protein